MSVWIIEQITEYIDKSPCRTEAQMEVMCCEPVGELECCKRVDGEWGGFTDDELNERLAAAGIGVDAQHRDSQGNYVEVVKVARPIPCGEQLTEYTLHQRRCCDDWVQIAIDTSKTPDVLPAGGGVSVYWTDGIPPFTVRTSSAGTWLPGGWQEVVTDGHYVPVYAGPTFCGVTVITIRDACGSVNWVLRSTLGQWVTYSDDRYTCSGAGSPESIGGTLPMVSYNGQYRMRFYPSINGCASIGGCGCTPGCASASAACAAWFGAGTDEYHCGLYPNLLSCNETSCPPGTNREIRCNTILWREHDKFIC